MGEEFKAEIREIDGKKQLFIKPRVEEIIGPDGSKSVIIHAPSLSMVADFKKVNGIE